MVMECSQPGTIRSEELLAYLAGEKVRPVVKQHLASCQYCSSQLATYQRMERTLLRKLYRSQCPSNQELGEYQLGLLGSDQATRVKEHLSKCVLCADEVATLRQFLASDAPLVERSAAPQQGIPALPSAQNHRRPLQDAARVLGNARDQSLAGVRRIIATLLPPQPGLALGVRGSQVLWPRRYAAEDVSIAVQLEPTSGRRGMLQLSGLVTRKGLSLEALRGTTVQLLSQAQTMYTQTIDELGNFVFSSIVPATYTLEVQFPDGVIVVEPLPVTAQE
jgi:anti-sigma factor RsiW